MYKPSLTVSLFMFCLSAPTHAFDEVAEVTTKVLTSSSQSWDGKELPPYPAGQPEIRIIRLTIPAGVELPVHNHPVINAGVLLSGELTVITENGDRLQLQAGDGLIEVVGTWHYGINEGDEPAEIIVFYAGAESIPTTVIK
ncbi:MAG: cupin domain-containing protein [Gammaproteobacteria bacterium]